jgi:hypothetical protein
LLVDIVAVPTAAEQEQIDENIGFIPVLKKRFFTGNIVIILFFARNFKKLITKRKINNNNK